jgi:hypothetical protein
MVRNCTICGNHAYGTGGGVDATDQRTTLLLVNCILVSNKGSVGTQLFSGGCTMIIGCPEIQIINCCLEDEPDAVFVENWSDPRRLSESCIQLDPLFAQPGHWYFDSTPGDSWGYVWVEGDYHLKSQAGRWDPVNGTWVKDEVTSPCIDAGDPNSPVGAEPFPNGGRVNMGAYGGTAEASKSPSGVHARYGDGAGEPNDPYLIYTAAQFKAIGANPDDWDRHFRLMADVDLGGSEANDVHTIGYWRSWTDCKPFRGSFDGNGHRILHFTWRSTGRDRVGLFGYIAGASSYLKPTLTIKNLGLIDPNVEAGTGDDVGALAGYFVDAAFRGCYVEGGRVSGDKHVGGLIGGTMDCVILSSIPRLDIRNCRATAQVSGTEAVGGLIGYYGGAFWPPTLPYLSCYEISGCCAAGEVTGTTKVGGLAGGRIFD